MYDSETIKKYLQEKAYQDEQKRKRLQELFSEAPASKLIGGAEISPLKTTGSFLGGSLLPPATMKHFNYAQGGSMILPNSTEKPLRFFEDMRTMQRSVLETEDNRSKQNLELLSRNELHQLK